MGRGFAALGNFRCVDCRMRELHDRVGHPNAARGGHRGLDVIHAYGLLLLSSSHGPQSLLKSLPVSDSKILVFSDESKPSTSEKISRGCRPAPPKFALHGTNSDFTSALWVAGAEPSEMAPQVVVVCEHVPATR
jgi:hypothetical protein